MVKQSSSKPPLHGSSLWCNNNPAQSGDVFIYLATPLLTVWTVCDPVSPDLPNHNPTNLTAITHLLHEWAGLQKQANMFSLERSVNPVRLSAVNTAMSYSDVTQADNTNI